MKRYGKRKLRIKMQLTIMKNRVVIHRTTKQKRTAIYKVIRQFQTQNPDNWKLCVVYGTVIDANNKKIEIKNSGEYKTAEELLTTLGIFTEKILLDQTEEWIKIYE